MKPLRKYQEATIRFRDTSTYMGGGGVSERDSEEVGYEVSVYSNLVIYFDKGGNERIVSLRDIKEIVEYAEDRNKELKK